MNITLDDGKYTVVGKTNGSLEALRYGEPWRDLTGDNLVLALCARIEDLEAAMRKALESFSETNYGNREITGNAKRLLQDKL